MKWVVFTYSLPSQSSSTQRVALWRRLRRLGAVSPTSGSHILPARDECVEVFQWLVQEIQQAKGEALSFQTEQISGLTDQELVDLFNATRAKEYEEIKTGAVELEKALHKPEPVDHHQFQERLNKLRRQHAEIGRIDYFHCTAGVAVARQLAQLEQALTPSIAEVEVVVPVAHADYQGRQWVTRPRPHVDRLACIWLIRRFIDPEACIRYSLQPEPDEIAFDMSEGAFGHRGNLCTFETMVRAFAFDEPALGKMAEIVHELDLHDGRYQHPETAGIDALLQGWLLVEMPDQALEAQGITLFEGLYQSFSKR
jgi:hypothetical protein